MNALPGDSFQRFVLRHVVREVENKLNQFSLVLVVIVALDIRFQLTAIPHNPLSSLLKRGLHVG
jgi:hypothetical protein